MSGASVLQFCCCCNPAAAAILLLLQSCCCCCCCNPAAAAAAILLLLLLLLQGSAGGGAANGSLSSSKSFKAFQFVSVCTTFKRQLAELMALLHQLEPHYVRCIKPNPASRPSQLDDAYTLHQLKCGGVMEAVRISCAGEGGMLTAARGSNVVQGGREGGRGGVWSGVMGESRALTCSSSGALAC
jgi:hypothetical protein